MTAQMMTLTADKGATFRLSIRYRDSDRQPVDISSGYTALLVISRGGGTAVHTEGATLTEDGWIRFLVSDEETATWPAGPYRYRVELIHPNGDKDYLLAGRFTIRNVYA